MLVHRLRRWPNMKSTYLTQMNTVCVTRPNRPTTLVKLVQWLKLTAWKCNDSILWGTSVTERWHARPQTARALISNLLCLEGSVISPSSGGYPGPA